MNEYYRFKCTNPLCIWSGQRYRNSKKCPLCDCLIERVDPIQPSKDQTIKTLTDRVTELEKNSVDAVKMHNKQIDVALTSCSNLRERNEKLKKALAEIVKRTFDIQCRLIAQKALEK